MRNKAEARFELRLQVLKTGRNVCFLGSDPPDTSGQQDAARTMANIAQRLDTKTQTLYDSMEKQLVADASNYGTIEQADKNAGLANADVQGALSQQKASTQRTLSSMGIDPSSGVYAGQANDNAIAGAAMSAGAKTKARNDTFDKGFAMKSDLLAGSRGLQGNAVNALNSAGNMYGSLANAQANQNAVDSANTSGMVRGGMNAYRLYKDYAADGGLVTKRGVKKTGLSSVKCLANGGKVSPYNGNPALQKMIDTQGTDVQVAGGQPSDIGPGDVRQAYDVAKMASSSPGGMAGMSQAAPVMSAGYVAPTATTAAEAAAATTAAETAAAATAAEAATAATAATTAAEIAPALLLLKNGGEVEAKGETRNDNARERKDMTKGGKVKGRGTETSDSIPAKVKAGSYVINAESAKMMGKAGLKDVEAKGDAGNDRETKSDKAREKNTVDVRLSKNEHVITPDKAKRIGINRLDSINNIGLEKRYGLANAQRRTA